MTFGCDPADGGRGSTRRDLIAAAGTGLVTGAAGCLGGSEAADGEPESTDLVAERRATLRAAEPYRMHQYGPAHVGAAGEEGPTDDVETVWTFREGPDDSYYDIGSPAVVDGVVYVAEGGSTGDDGAETTVYALDGATGDVEWEWTYPGTNSFGATVVADGAVVLAVGRSVVALTADGGEKRWRLERDFADVLAVAGGTVYAIDTTYADPPTLVAVDLETGSERWSTPLADDRRFLPTSPAVVDGTVYQGGTELRALSAGDGDQQWSRDLGSPITGPPTVVDDAIYVPVGDGTVAALDRDGATRWRVPVEHGGQGYGLEAVTSPAVADGTLYATNAWRLTALEADTGTERWTTETAGNRAPVVADGVVYASGLNTVVAHDGADGEPLWRHRTDATSASGDPTAPVVGGTVFFPSAGLHALRGAGESS